MHYGKAALVLVRGGQQQGKAGHSPRSSQEMHDEKRPKWRKRRVRVWRIGHAGVLWEISRFKRPGGCGDAIRTFRGQEDRDTRWVEHHAKVQRLCTPLRCKQTSVDLTEKHKLFSFWKKSQDTITTPASKSVPTLQLCSLSNQAQRRQMLTDSLRRLF